MCLLFFWMILLLILCFFISFPFLVYVFVIVFPLPPLVFGDLCFFLYGTLSSLFYFVLFLGRENEWTEPEVDWLRLTYFSLN